MDTKDYADTVVFLNRYPILLGHCLVAPKRRRKLGARPQ